MARINSSAANRDSSGQRRLFRSRVRTGDVEVSCSLRVTAAWKASSSRRNLRRGGENLNVFAAAAPGRPATQAPTRLRGGGSVPLELEANRQAQAGTCSTASVCLGCARRCRVPTLAATHPEPEGPERPPEAGTCYKP